MMSIALFVSTSVVVKRVTDGHIAIIGHGQPSTADSCQCIVMKQDSGPGATFKGDFPHEPEDAIHLGRWWMWTGPGQQMTAWPGRRTWLMETFQSWNRW